MQHAGSSAARRTLARWHAGTLVSPNSPVSQYAAPGRPKCIHVSCLIPLSARDARRARGAAEPCAVRAVANSTTSRFHPFSPFSSGSGSSGRRAESHQSSMPPQSRMPLQRDGGACAAAWALGPCMKRSGKRQEGKRARGRGPVLQSGRLTRRAWLGLRSRPTGIACTDGGVRK